MTTCTASFPEEPSEGRPGRDRSRLDVAIDGVAATGELVHAKTRTVERMLSKMSEVISDITEYCHQQKEILNRAGYENHHDTARPRRPIPRDRVREDNLKKAAELGVFDFRIEPQPNGWGKATVQGKTLDLPPALSHLLAILALDTGGFWADKFVPWKTIEVLHQRMEKARGVTCKRGGLRNLVYRLRRIFAENELNPFFIATGPRGSARLLLRRRINDGGHGGTGS